MGTFIVEKLTKKDFLMETTGESSVRTEAYIMEALEKESGTESGVLLTATLTWFKKNT